MLIVVYIIQMKRSVAGVYLQAVLVPITPYLILKTLIYFLLFLIFVNFLLKLGTKVAIIHGIFVLLHAELICFVKTGLEGAIKTFEKIQKLL